MPLKYSEKIYMKAINDIPHGKVYLKTWPYYVNWDNEDHMIGSSEKRDGFAILIELTKNGQHQSQIGILIISASIHEGPRISNKVLGTSSIKDAKNKFEYATFDTKGNSIPYFPTIKEIHMIRNAIIDHYA